MLDTIDLLEADPATLNPEQRRRKEKLEDIFGNERERLIESMGGVKFIKLFHERDINFRYTCIRRHDTYQDQHLEIDLLAVGDDEAMAVEVQTVLCVSDLDAFADKIKVLKDRLREFDGKKVYGTVAYIRGNSEDTERAAKRGLFVIKAVGDSAKIENSPNFRPRSF